MLNCALCDYTTKSKQCLSQHAMLSHDVGLVWHACDAAPGECDFQAKTVYRLQDHIRRMHARVYAQRKKQQEERVRRALLDAGWQERRLAEAMPPVGYFRREKRVDFKCAELNTGGKFASIDFVLGVPNGFVFLEVDEQQHKYGYDASRELRHEAHEPRDGVARRRDRLQPAVHLLAALQPARVARGRRAAQECPRRSARRGSWRGSRRSRAPRRCASATRSTTARRRRTARCDVLDNAEYNPEFTEVVDNLMDLELE